MAEIVKKERVPYRIWDKVNSKWNELMLKTNAKSVDAADGKTLETKIGAVNGITSDLNGEASDVAASIKCVNQLNNSLGGIKFGIDSDGNYGYYKAGADSVTPFSSDSDIIYIGTGGTKNDKTTKITFDVSSKLSNYKEITADNFLVNITKLGVRAYNPSGNGDGSVKYADISTVPSYDSSTGVLTITVYRSVTSNYANSQAFIGSCDVYYISSPLSSIKSV